MTIAVTLPTIAVDPSACGLIHVNSRALTVIRVPPNRPLADTTRPPVNVIVIVYVFVNSPPCSSVSSVEDKNITSEVY